MPYVGAGADGRDSRAEQSKTGSRVNEQGRDGLGGDQSAEFSCSRNIYCTAYQHVSISAYQHAAYSQCCRALLRMMSKKEQKMNGEHTWRHLCKWEQFVRRKLIKEIQRGINPSRRVVFWSRVGQLGVNWQRQNKFPMRKICKVCLKEH